MSIKRYLVILLALLLLLTPVFTACENVSIPEPSSGESAVPPESGDPASMPDESSVPDGSDESSDPEESKVPQDTVISFLACPDVIIHSSVFYDAINRAAEKNGTDPVYNDLHNVEYDFYPIFEYVSDAISQADVAYVNQETLPGSDKKAVSGYPRFNSPFAIADTIAGLGFDVVNLAHNHMLDAGNASYAANAYKLFTDAGLTAIGYYKNDAAVDDIPVVECKGVKIAMLAYTYGTNGIRLPSSEPEIIPYFSKELLQRQIPKAKEVADLVFVSAHWGNENNFNLASLQKEYADLMCELGVDVVIGMHPHVIQKIEWKTAKNGHKTLIAYSLGNYISGMKAAKNLLAGMLEFNIVKSAATGEITIDDPLFIPTVTHYVKTKTVSSSDTGFREFKIYYLSDYNEGLASKHGVHNYESSKGSSLTGGKFSYANLIKTLKKYIDPEFLPEEFR